VIDFQLTKFKFSATIIPLFHYDLIESRIFGRTHFMGWHPEKFSL